MPLYMIQAAYTAEAWAALARKPENRAEALSALSKQMGGRLVDLYYCFGEYDVIALGEYPDDTTASAAVIAAISAGHVRASRTTRLMTVNEAMEAMRKAGSATYAPPAGMSARA
jgi:uncharacterized protein with GYD domain